MSKKYCRHIAGVIITAAQLNGGYNVFIKGVTIIDQCPDPAVYAMLEEEQTRYEAEITILYTSTTCEKKYPHFHTGGVIGDGSWSIDTNGTVGVHVNLKARPSIKLR